VIGKKVVGQGGKTTDVVLRAAEGTPAMEAAGQARAARTLVKERLMLKLYQPLARLVGVGREYFEDQFPQDMAQKTAGIPDDHLVAPRPSVGVPAMQGLAYSVDEPDLKEMYLNLLTTAVDDRRANGAHPAFAEIIKQLAPDEANDLNITLARDVLPCVRLDLKTDSGFNTLRTHLLPLGDDDGPLEEPHQATWVDNWQRLGLVDVDYTSYLTRTDAYDWVEARPEYQRLQGPAGDKLKIKKGILRRTDFGEAFRRAVAPPPAE
jgi:hypothetical protein